MFYKIATDLFVQQVKTHELLLSNKTFWAYGNLDIIKSQKTLLSRRVLYLRHS